MTADMFPPELADGPDDLLVVPRPLCLAKLPRCCGEGPLICEKPTGHAGPHEEDGVCWG